MHARLSSGQVHCKTKFLTQALDQYTSSLAIKEFHPPNMAREVPFNNEIREHSEQESHVAFRRVTELHTSNLDAAKKSLQDAHVVYVR